MGESDPFQVKVSLATHPTRTFFKSYFCSVLLGKGEHAMVTWYGVRWRRSDVGHVKSLNGRLLVQGDVPELRCVT